MSTYSNEEGLTMTTTIFRKRGIDNSHFEGKGIFKAEVVRVWALAQKLYPDFTLSLRDVPVVFFNTGRAAGQAQGSRYMGYNLGFNTRAIKADWDHCFYNTIPHEIAHIVDMHMNMGRGHSAQWKRISKSLGCTGARCHSIALEPSRKVSKVIYRASCGTEVTLTMNMHNKIQRGQVRILRATKGRITAQGFMRMAA